MLYDLSILQRHQERQRVLPDLQLTRRGLMASTAFLALATATSVGPVGAWAATGVTAEQRLTLIRMARDIYPHDDFLPDKPYVDAVDGILKDAADDPEVRKVVLAGVEDLEARAAKTYSKRYIAIADANKREGILRSIELTDFFQKFRGALLMGIYNNKELWPKFGYDGSSWENGGFMDNFDKIDWL
jgi:hypothetical protein